MIESFLITSRETLEASLVVGIVLSYLTRTNQRAYNKVVYWGIIAALVASALAAVIFIGVAGGFEGKAEAIFEGTTMLIAAALLTTMILWMFKQRNIAQNIKDKVQKHIAKAQMSQAGIYGLFFLIFFAILREGVETVIFMSAISYSSGISFLGGLLGVAVAIAIGWLFFLSAKKVNLKKFFNISSVLLILFAAGLVAHGVHEFEEAGVLDGIVAPVWDINPELNPDGSYPALHEKGLVGSFLTGLFGYNGNPSLLELLAYGAYLVGIWAVWRRMSVPEPARQ